jgi:hypothetical protein
MRNYKYKYIKIKDFKYKDVTHRTLERRGYKLINVDFNRVVVVFKKICK